MREGQKFKGAAFNSLVKAIRERFGEEGLQKVVRECGPEVKRLINRKVLDNEWVSDYPGDELQVKTDQIFGRGDGRIMKEIGYTMAMDNLRGIYKVFVKFTSLKSVLKRANVIWSKYFNKGWINVLDEGKNHYSFEIVDYDPLPSTCAGVEGWLNMFLEVYKKKGTVEHSKCKLRGDKKCIYELKWE
jgi:hypothetical protein